MTAMRVGVRQGIWSRCTTRAFRAALLTRSRIRRRRSRRGRLKIHIIIRIVRSGEEIFDGVEALVRPLLVSVYIFGQTIDFAREYVERFKEVGNIALKSLNRRIGSGRRSFIHRGRRGSRRRSF